MEEQANLLPGVATAHDLMHRVVDLQGRINQLTTQFATKTEKKTKRHPASYAIGGFLIAFTLITSTPLKVITYLPTLPFFSMGRHGASIGGLEYREPHRLSYHRCDSIQGHSEDSGQKPLPEKCRD